MTDLSATVQGTVKPWYQSRTIIGAAVTALSAIAGLTGHGLPMELQGQAVDLLAGVGGLVGAGLSFWGRLKATAAIR